MIDLVLIGIGTGNPEHLTLQAIRALNSVDLILIPRKGENKADLAGLRRTIVSEVVTDPAVKLREFDLPERNPNTLRYKTRVDDWHDAIADVWTDAIKAHQGPKGRVALLVWGDPSLYDSTLRIAARVGRQLPLQVSVIPGITSMQALTAAHAIPLNEINGPFIVTTGRRLRDEGWPKGADRVVVMLDGECSFQTLPTEGITIWWCAYAGMPNQIIKAGALEDVGPSIVDMRAEAREAHGWIMDIYLMERSL